MGTLFLAAGPQGRAFWFACCLAACVTLAPAQNAPTPAQISAATSAATASAAARLREEILSQPINRSITVDDMVVRTGGGALLEAALARAEMIGGPRWTGPQTCQVQLVLPASRICDALLQMQSDHPHLSPVTSEELRAWADGLAHRTFAATGASMWADSVPRPNGAPAPSRPGDPWAGVSNDARRDAVVAAKRDAVARLEQSIASVSITEKQSIGDVLAISDVHRIIDDWLSARPIARVRFHDDLSAEVSLAVMPAEVCAFLEGVLKSRTDVVQPKDESAWTAICQSITARLAAPVGRAATSMPAPEAEPPAIALPSHRPAWANDVFESEASAAGPGSRLLMARSAQALATGELRHRIESLALDQTMTVGAAAHHDPRFADALKRAMAQVRVARAEYFSDGRVTVRVYLDLHLLWEALQNVP